jgi:hypothetical protein
MSLFAVAGAPVTSWDGSHDALHGTVHGACPLTIRVATVIRRVDQFPIFEADHDSPRAD